MLPYTSRIGAASAAASRRPRPSVRGRTPWLRAIAVGALAFVAACGGGGDDGPTGPDANVVGTYTLRTLNGSALPGLLSLETGGRRVDLLAEAITFNADRSYAHTATQRTSLGSQVTTENLAWTGTYSVSGNTVTLSRAADGARATLTHGSDGSLTLTASGLTYVYRR
jgi:hypothetical protein